jgi:hypothetical protein
MWAWWDAFMVALALANVTLIVFDWTYRWLRPFYQQHVPGLVETYDPWVDRFWLLDLPFLAFFAAEFTVRWAAAIRAGTLRRWWFFPLLHWYDALGLVPLVQFRFFRLFRVISIYARLHRSELTAVGDDPLTRGANFLADVVTEEVSDRVAERLLNLAQIEIRHGVLMDVSRRLLIARREVVKERISAKLAEILASGELRERARELLAVSLEEAVEEAPVLRAIPLPDRVLRPLVRGLGQAVYDSILQTLAATARSPEGRQALDGLVDAVMMSLEAELGSGQIEQLIEETVIEALEEMKTAVRARRWAEGEPEGAGGRAAKMGAP